MKKQKQNKHTKQGKGSAAAFLQGVVAGRDHSRDEDGAVKEGLVRRFMAQLREAAGAMG